jgi:hypothetical protein
LPGEIKMKKNLWKLLCCAGLGLVVSGVSLLSIGRSEAANSQSKARSESYEQQRRIVADYGFGVDILVNGRPLEEYYARGRSYVEASPGYEYEVRIYNPLSQRVAVALSVDGLNSIDARRTSAWNASKWVIEPYGTIHVGGWQMSSERARRFYFTTERDSYAAKLGQTSNLGMISAVFFREARPVPIPIAPPPRERPLYDESRRSESRPQSRSEAPKSGEAQGMARDRSGAIAPVPDDDYAATGIGRSVRNDVRWVNMDLDSRPVGEVTIRYEFYQGLVRLGIMPRPPHRPDPLGRREGATGFEDRRFSPEP